MNEPRVLISIINWNNASSTIDCVNSVLKNISYPRDLYKIVIVDNASVDDSYKEIVTAFPDLEVIKSPDNMGFSAGHYHTFLSNKDKGFDLFWILNNDLVIYEHTLPELVKAYKDNGEALYGSISVKGGRTIEFGGLQEIFDYSIINHQEDVFYGKDISELISPRTYWTTQVYGFSMLMPFTLIEKYGFLSHDFFMYHEETEYCLRLLIKHHIKTYIVQTSLVNHETSTSFKKSHNLQYIKDYYISRNFPLLGNLAYGHKKRSYFKQDLSVFWRYPLLLIPSSIVLKNFSHPFIKRYYQDLGKFHYYLNKFGKTIKPEDYL
jgi:GT2 family glycosyltransferase